MTDLNPMEGVIEYFRAKGNDVDDRRADLMEEAYRIVREAQGRQRLQLPVKIDDLGDPVTVSYGEVSDGSLGQADQETGEIVIKEGQQPLGEIVILIHEVLHLVEGSALDQGIIEEGLPHDFVSGASCMIAIALARCGALSTVSPESVSDQIKKLQPESEGD